MDKVYVIVGCMSGEDCSLDNPTIFEICDTLEKAKIDFENIVDDIKDGFSDDCDFDFNLDTKVFEYTDFENDEHGIIKIIEKEILRRGE